MHVDLFLDLLRQCPLIASVQASPNSAVDHPETLLQLARASLDQGVKVLRLQGVANIKRIREGASVPTIGLIKANTSGSEVFITPTTKEIDLLLDQRCEVIALDGTRRSRPDGSQLSDLIQRIHDGGALAMADCDQIDSARYAKQCGADLIGTTLAGYTAESQNQEGPDLELVRQLAELGTPIIAEGRYSERWQVEAALRIGAAGVVVGGALNDPVKQTRALMPLTPANTNIGAVDIGGTWLRFGVFSPDWKLVSSERIPNPPNRIDRLEWIRGKAGEHGVQRIGVSTGGIVDPRSGICWNAKEYLMPDQIGIEFSESTLGVQTFAHGDGHATAWGHSCLPEFAGRRLATLALGTGVGCGFVEEGRIWSGRRGEYPRINDLAMSTGATFEAVLGGLNLSTTPTADQKRVATLAFDEALTAIRNLYFPDEVIVAGSVGLSDWLRPHVEAAGAIPSPFGTDAGLYGAAALALYPPVR